MSTPSKQILVIGSLNADLVQRVDRMPIPGQTILGGEFRVFGGGKGANQACAAGRLGGRTKMLGCVGNDVFGGQLTSELASAGVDVSPVLTMESSSGVATILVSADGENMIVVAPGANALLRPEAAVAVLSTMAKGDVVLFQLESPLETVAAALAAARARGIVTILDPAPVAPLSAEVLGLVDIITPNQTEAATLLGSAAPISTLAEARQAAEELLKRGPRSVIMKLGALGSLVASEGRFVEVPGFVVTAVDTTAAGDTYNGALAVALSEGSDIFQAARFANAAAALSVTQPGAMNSIPTRSATDAFLAAHPA